MNSEVIDLLEFFDSDTRELFFTTGQKLLEKGKNPNVLLIEVFEEENFFLTNSEKCNVCFDITGVMRNINYPCESFMPTTRPKTLMVAKYIREKLLRVEDPCVPPVDILEDIILQGEEMVEEVPLASLVRDPEIKGAVLLPPVEIEEEMMDYSLSFQGSYDVPVFTAFPIAALSQLNLEFQVVSVPYVFCRKWNGLQVVMYAKDGQWIFFGKDMKPYVFFDTEQRDKYLHNGIYLDCELVVINSRYRIIVVDLIMDIANVVSLNLHDRLAIIRSISFNDSVEIQQYYALSHLSYVYNDKWEGIIFLPLLSAYSLSQAGYYKWKGKGDTMDLVIKETKNGEIGAYSLQWDVKNKKCGYRKELSLSKQSVKYKDKIVEFTSQESRFVRVRTDKDKPNSSMVIDIIRASHVITIDMLKSWFKQNSLIYLKGMYIVSTYIPGFIKKRIYVYDERRYIIYCLP